jgi:hypothetical protein
MLENFIKYQECVQVKRKGRYYRKCSCGAMLKSTNRASIIIHRKAGHKIPMKKWERRNENVTTDISNEQKRK